MTCPRCARRAGPSCRAPPSRRSAPRRARWPGDRDSRSARRRGGGPVRSPRRERGRGAAARRPTTASPDHSPARSVRPTRARAAFALSPRRAARAASGHEAERHVGERAGAHQGRTLEHEGPAHRSVRREPDLPAIRLEKPVDHRRSHSCRRRWADQRGDSGGRDHGGEAVQDGMPLRRSTRFSRRRPASRVSRRRGRRARAEGRRRC